jgi:hypothetical protein
MRAPRKFQAAGLLLALVVLPPPAHGADAAVLQWLHYGAPAFALCVWAVWRAGAPTRRLRQGAVSRVSSRQ